MGPSTRAPHSNYISSTQAYNLYNTIHHSEGRRHQQLTNTPYSKLY
nr:MAG TPA: hypothetical protein [Caudoviricetes sp.]